MRVETAVVVVVAALLLFGGYLFQERGSTRTLLSDTERRRLVLEGDVVALQQELVVKEAEVSKSRTDLESAQVQLEERQASAAESFPSRAQANGLGTQIFAYAADNGLGIGYFETAEGVGTIGGRSTLPSSTRSPRTALQTG